MAAALRQRPAKHIQRPQPTLPRADRRGFVMVATPVCTMMATVAGGRWCW
jgi:hypothetical protein